MTFCLSEFYSFAEFKFAHQRGWLQVGDSLLQSVPDLANLWHLIGDVLGPEVLDDELDDFDKNGSTDVQNVGRPVVFFHLFLSLQLVIALTEQLNAIDFELSGIKDSICLAVLLKFFGKLVKVHDDSNANDGSMWASW